MEWAIGMVGGLFCMGCGYLFGRMKLLGSWGIGVRKGKLIYLASPYTHADKAVEAERAERAAEAGAALKRMGYFVFAPVPHGHALAKYGLPTDWEWWQRFCRLMLDRCDAIVVLQLDGWSESTGVTYEISHMESSGKPVHVARLTDLRNETWHPGVLTR